MTTLTVEIDDVKDLTVLQAMLKRLDLKYTVEEDWGQNISDRAIEGIKAGLADIENGRIHTHEEVTMLINQQIQNFRK